MGFFDRIRTALGGMAGARVDFAGPLRLAPGDGVVHYGERWLVAGVRVLEFEDGREHHYCLRGPKGERTVLVAQPGTDGPLLSLEHATAPEVRTDGDVIEGVGEEPFRLSRKGHARVHVSGDVGAGSSARGASFREFLDAEGDRRIVAEDYAGHREVRVGEASFEGEFEFLRAAGESTPSAADPADAELPEDAGRKVGRGSPQAAARALLGAGGEEAPAAREDVSPSEEREPGFEDERWADEEDEPVASVAAEAPAASQESEEEQWAVAYRMLRETSPAPR